MSVLYLECNMGAAGDMLAAALYELCTDAQKQTFLQAMQALLPHGVAVQPQAVTVCGIAATHMAVTVHGQAEAEQAHDHTHAHDHDTAHPHDSAPTHTHHPADTAHDTAHGLANSTPHAHEHYHAAPAHIAALLDALALPVPVRESAKAVYASIAQAESLSHGVPVEDIHFHEVGALDAVADVTAVCLLAHLLAPDAVVVSPIATGSGTVRCAHGVLPVPAPATAHLLAGAPTWAGPERGELCTPTGAALLRRLATEYGPMPVMTVEKIGCGAGTKMFATANLVRAFWGVPQGQSGAGAFYREASPPRTHAAADCVGAAAAPNEAICALACNLDDATAEEISFALTALLGAGAIEAYTTSITMKKSRAGTLLTALCHTEDADRLAALLLHTTPTLGVRRTEHARYALARSIVTVNTQYGSIRVKAAHGYSTSKAKPEYDDVAAAAQHTGASFAQVREAALAAFAALR